MPFCNKFFNAFLPIDARYQWRFHPHIAASVSLSNEANKRINFKA